MSLIYNVPTSIIGKNTGLTIKGTDTGPFLTGSIDINAGNAISVGTGGSITLRSGGSSLGQSGSLNISTGIYTTTSINPINIKGSYCIGSITGGPINISGGLSGGTSIPLTGYSGSVILNGYSITEGHTNIETIQNTAINTWYTNTISPTNWISICWSSELGLFCGTAISGSTNRVITSTDGINWLTRTTTSLDLYSICWSPKLGIFCSVSNSTSIMTSSDGITWSTRLHNNPYSWLSICWSPELSIFCAAGGSGTERIMTSSNAIIWATRTSYDQSYFSICWSPQLSLFCTVGSDRISTSSDGIVWITRLSGRWVSICWSPQMLLFCAVSNDGTNDIITSPDGINWTTKIIGNAIENICWSPELSLFCGISNISIISNNNFKSINNYTTIGTDAVSNVNIKGRLINIGQNASFINIGPYVNIGPMLTTNFSALEPLYTPNTPYMYLDASGTVQSVANNNPTILSSSFWTTQFINNITYTTNNTITILIPGIYNINYSIEFSSNSTGIRSIYFLINSSIDRYANNTAKSATGSITVVNSNTSIYLNSGDIIKMVCYQDSGSSLNVGSSSTKYSNISIVKISG